MLSLYVFPFFCPSRALQHLGAWGHILGDPDVASDDGTPTDGDAPEDGAVAVDDDVVLEDGMAGDALDGLALGIEGEALGPERDSLVELDVGADDARGADDHSRAVVDGEVAADGGGGVYVDACLAMGHLGDDAWDEGYT